MASVTTLFAEGGHWDTPTIDYVGCEAVYPWDGNTGRSRVENRAALAGLSFRLPIVGAMMLDGNALIYIIHSPSVHLADVLNPSPFDGQFVVLLGNDLTWVTPIVVVDTTALRTTTEHHVFDVATLTRAAGHLAGPAVYQHEAQVNGTVSTTAVRGQKFCLLPPSCCQAALTNAVHGRMSTLQFYGHILQGPLGSAVPTKVAMFEQVSLWWRLACHRATGTAAGTTSLVTTARIPGTLPIHDTGLAQHVRRLATPLLAKLGHGGPALSTAAFNAGIVVLEESMAASRDAQTAIAIRNDATTVLAQRGPAVAQELCNVLSCIEL